MMRRTVLCAAVASIICASGVARGNVDALREHLLVVYNKDAARSEELARYYAEKRHIPEERVYGIHCSQAEQITRVEYNETIRDPIETYMKTKGWLKRDLPTQAMQWPGVKIEAATHNDVWAIVLMRGVPLKIANDAALLAEHPPQSEKFATNAAAVDSELATLPIKGTPTTAFVDNPYHFAGYARDYDEYDSKKLILVTRLDGPTADGVRRMIDDSLDAEAHRLTGLVCLDARGITDPKNNYIMGDQWLRHCAVLFRQDGFPVEFDDQPALFAENLPWNDVAFYAGWYSDNASGFFFHPPHRFARGGIAYHIHSFSAASIRDKNSYWAGPLLDAGASAVVGSVYEPYLIMMPHADVLAVSLLQGETFAEAAYQSEPALSWMITVVGDPLYRPFAMHLPEAMAQTDLTAPLRDRLLLQKVRRDLPHHPEDFNRKKLEEEVVRSDSTFIAWEGIGDLLSKLATSATPEDMIDFYRRAFESAPEELDMIRTGMKLARAYAQAKQDAAGEKILTILRQRFPQDAPFYGFGLSNEPGQPGPPVPLPPVPVSPLNLPQLPKPPVPPAPTRR